MLNVAFILSISVLPQPVHVQAGEGIFVLRSDMRIVTDKASAPAGAMLASWLAPATGFTLDVSQASDADNTISMRLDSSLARLGKEGYVLDVTPRRVTIRAPQAAGVFYGAQTLRQLLPPAVFAATPQEGAWTIPAVRIEDQPRFAWRGAMLDVSRHFSPKEFVLRFIDLLALHKLNTFHWHLTDDQGWRIEIKKYPRLTEVGAWRKQTRLGHERDPRGFDKKPHGGFYTQQDIRDVVQYARQRHITIVPEIEMPGHAQAAIAAYPELGVTGQPLEVWTRWGINANIFNPSERTILFLQDVLNEVLELFPGQFIHVGGDEAIKDQWKASPQVQARIKELGLKDEHEMQSYVIRRMDSFLASKGRRLIGWDEILEGGLAPGATVMSWRGIKGGITAAKAGHDVVMAPTTHVYLDYAQSKEPGEPLNIGGDLPLKTVYSFEPVPADFTADEGRRVLGAQGNIWTEYMPSPGHVEYMAFPRLVALAEVTWTPAARKSYGDFLSRLAVHEQRLTNLDVNFKPTVIPSREDGEESGRGPAMTVHPEIWPAVKYGIARDRKIESGLDALLAKMSVEEKVAQLMQPSVAHINPEDVRTYHFGSVLNGGGGLPGDIRKTTRKDWLDMSDAFYEASMDTTGGKNAIPIMWGSDAVHGHSNVIGATLFPHNIGLGATRNGDLVRRIGEITATEMAITGVDWDFSPVVAVARDDRWGRTYESYSEDPKIVKTMAEELVRGLQNGRFKVMATAKHFIADGGTAGGKDQGDTQVGEAELRDIHAPGYVGALQAGVQTIMVSQSSWNGREMHGHRGLLTDVLKERMGFDGLLLGDWNGHGQVPGCTNQTCPAAINAGLDMFMVPEDWKALYENTLAQVRAGQIPTARLDDAVRRILRVKMRAGLFTAGKPSQRPAAKQDALFGSRAHRGVARQAVRESLVLLKNNGGVLPIRPQGHVLVAGDGAHNIGKQSGGWTVSWQGDGNTNQDFPGGTSIWSGIRLAVEAAGGRAVISPDGSFQEKPDVAIVVFGENPYAEWLGDLRTIIYHNDNDLALLRRLKAAGIPIVSVFLSGRPLWVNPFLNASDAFVAAWLPGSEGHGVADVLFGNHDFKGKLSFSWPKRATQVVLNAGDPGYDPLFPLGFGLTYNDRRNLPELSVDTEGIDPARKDVFFSAGPVEPWKLFVDKSLEVREEPAARRAVKWSGQGGEVSLRSDKAVDLRSDAANSYALAIDLMIEEPPSSAVTLSLGNGALEVSALLRGLPVSAWQTVRIPLRCFAEAGADLSRVDTPFRLTTAGSLALRFADIELVPPTAGPTTTCPPAQR